MLKLKVILFMIIIHNKNQVIENGSDVDEYGNGQSCNIYIR